MDGSRTGFVKPGCVCLHSLLTVFLVFEEVQPVVFSPCAQRRRIPIPVKHRGLREFDGIRTGPGSPVMLLLRRSGESNRKTRGIYGRVRLRCFAHVNEWGNGQRRSQWRGDQSVPSIFDAGTEAANR